MGPRRAVVVRIVLGTVFLVLLVLAHPAMTHARAAGVLLRLGEGVDNPLGLRDFATVPFVRTPLSIKVGEGSFPAYLYAPDATGSVAVGAVLVHGVHYRGIDEARLVKFAESLAASGVTVLTPAIESLQDYHVDQEAVARIGLAAHALRERLGGDKHVGVIGISFAGSLSLLAAASPKMGDDIGYVVTVGAYDDLARVSRFYATGRIERPDGKIVSQTPHEYGPVVWVYSHMEDFFPAEDLTLARASLQSWLHEDRDAARAILGRIAAPSRARLEAIYSGKVVEAFPEIPADIERHARELAALSPHEHLEGIHVPVFLLHGSDDSLVPASETMWLAHDLPPGMLAFALISRALTHVELGGQASLAERWQAIHFMAGVLAKAKSP
jgi:dienelactone hydrolase